MPNIHGGQNAIESEGALGGRSFLGFGAGAGFTGLGAGAGFSLGGSTALTGSGTFTGSGALMGSGFGAGFTGIGLGIAAFFGFGFQAFLKLAKNPGFAGAPPERIGFFSVGFGTTCGGVTG